MAGHVETKGWDMTKMLHRCGVTAVLGAVVVALVAPTAGATTGSTAAKQLQYGGSAWGSYAFVGDTVLAGKTAPVDLGQCVLSPPVHRERSAAGANVPPIFNLGAIHDTADATSSGGVDTATTQSRVADVGMLGGLITADTVTSRATVTHDSNGFDVSAHGTRFANLKVAGVPIPITVPPNTKIALPGIGSVTLNEQVADVRAKKATLTVNAIHVDVTEDNALGIPKGAQVYVAHARASLLLRNFNGILHGFSYGAVGRALGNQIKIGRVAPISLPCFGTNGVTRHNTSAGVSIPGIITSGTVDDTVYGIQTADGGAVTTSSTVQGLDLLSGLVGATTIKAQANGTKDANGSTFDDDGSFFLDLSVAGFPNIGDDVAPNTKLKIAGLGTLWLHRVIQDANSIEVRMVELKVTEANAFGLPVGADIRVAVAHAGID
jgi:hypothetical protein